MGDIKFENNAVTVLSSSVNPGDTAMVVASATSFPSLGSGDWMYVTVGNEFIKVTGIAGSTFTCEEIGVAHFIGDTVELRTCKELLEDLATSTELTDGLALKMPATRDTFGKNLIINPEGLVNQEGYVDGVSIGAGEWVYDMWFAYASSFGSFNASRSNGAITFDNTGQSYDAVVRTANDDINSVPDGTTLTMSMTISNIVGSPTVDGYGIAASTPLSNGDMVITFVKDTSGTATWDTERIEFFLAGTDGGATSAKFTISKFKLEVGSVATKYETPCVTKNELDCYRYFVSHSGHLPVSAYSYTSSAINVTLPLSAPLSKSPIITAKGMTFHGNGTAPVESGILTPSFVSHTPMAVYALLTTTAAGSIFSANHTYTATVNSGDSYFKIDARPSI